MPSEQKPLTMSADREAVLRNRVNGYRCEPINQNLNFLECLLCGRKWHFEDGTGSKVCEAKARYAHLDIRDALAAYDAERTAHAEIQERLADALRTKGGHKQPCYYCGENCNSLAANPGKWPIPLCHPDDPGKVKWHHIGCVSERLERLAEAQRERDEK